MATNLALDDELIKEAQEVGHHRSKKEAVTAALSEYVRRHRQQDILTLFGQMDYQADYDYKKQRKQE